MKLKVSSKCITYSSSGWKLEEKPETKKPGPTRTEPVLRNYFLFSFTRLEELVGTIIQRWRERWSRTARWSWGSMNTPEEWFLSPEPGCRLYCIPQRPVRPPPAAQTGTDAACQPARLPRPPVSPAGHLRLNAAQGANQDNWTRHRFTLGPMKGLTLTSRS